MAINSLRGFKQTCRIRVRIGKGDELVTRLIFAHQVEGGMNTPPIEDTVFLEPGGLQNTDDVDYLSLLPWADDTNTGPSLHP
ncbi:MAG: hypothetical protein WCV79_02330 [Candidatus Paceibacterota bacterium]|jgi:hypothetical protein